MKRQQSETDPLVLDQSASDKNFIRILGPCSAESKEQLLETAKALLNTNLNYFRAGLWKPRTRAYNFEGVGAQGLSWLLDVRDRFEIPVCTEVATPEHVELVLEAGLDAIWLGARTVVSPFAVQSIADSLKGVEIPIFVKNPINPDLNLWYGAIERLAAATNLDDIAAIHRGFSTYNSKPYRNSPMWQIPIELKRRLPKLKVLCDASHISGNRDLIPAVVQSAVNLDFDGLMIETHSNPEQALSDAQQQLTPKDLERLMAKIVWKIKDITDPDTLANIKALRHDIDTLDQEILELLAARMDVVREIGRYKEDTMTTILQMKRWQAVFDKRQKEGEKLKLSPSFIADLMQCIHQESIVQQNDLLKKEDGNA